MLETLKVQDEKTVKANPYETLKDISEVQPYDAQEDRALFAELAQVLRKYDADDRFGVALLHDHFEVNA